MKKLIMLLLPLVISCHTKTPEEKMKDGIKAYLSKTMHDFKSYEPVDYKKVDSTYTSYLTTERGLSLLDSIKYYNKVWEDLLDQAKEYQYTSPTTSLKILKGGRICQAKIDSLTNVMKNEKSAFVKRFDGYKMIHSFRGKNMNGATILSTKKFFFDTTFTVVDEAEVE